MAVGLKNPPQNAVLELTDTIIGHFENKYKTLAIFLDLSNAFDTVSIPILLSKMEHLDIRGTVYDLFRLSYSQRTMHKKSAPGSPQLHSSNESSDEEQKPRQKADGRADRYFYETLMCQQPPDHPKFGSPESMKRRDASLARNKVEYSRKFREVSDTEKNDSEDYSEDIASKNVDSSLVESDDVLQELGLKKRGRRGKFAPFQQVVNFMGKTTRRN